MSYCNVGHGVLYIVTRAVDVWRTTWLTITAWVTARGLAAGCVPRSCAYTRSSRRRGRAENSLAFASSDRAALTAAPALLAAREIARGAPVSRPVNSNRLGGLLKRNRKGSVLIG